MPLRAFGLFGRRAIHPIPRLSSSLNALAGVRSIRTALKLTVLFNQQGSLNALAGVRSIRTHFVTTYGAYCAGYVLMPLRAFGLFGRL